MSRTRSLRRGVVAALALAGGASAVHAQIPVRKDAPPAPSGTFPTRAPAPMPVRPAAIPTPQEATLGNGLRLMLVEGKRQPVVSISLLLPAGDSYDPAGKEGLAEMVAGLLTKGAGSRSADEVSAAIEGVGGSIGASTGADFLTVSANVLAPNAPLAFELVADAVARPTFAAKEVDLLRTQTLSGLQLQLSQPGALAQRFFARALFGNHPYARRPAPTSVNAITADDLRAFQRTRLVPQGALLVVAGDITLADARRLAEQHFGSWTGTAPAAASRPKPPARTSSEIILVHRPGSVQSNIVAGNLTFEPASPDFYALNVANKVLGGGSDGRLFLNLREKRGWTYGAYSSLDRFKDVGALVATAEVRTEVTDSSLVELIALMRAMRNSPVPATELEAAKGTLVGRLPLEIETAQQVAGTMGRYTMLGLPRDYITTVRPRLAAVTAAQVQEAARSYIRPDQALVVVVGDGTKIYDKLAKIAPTRIINSQGDPMTPADLRPAATTAASAPLPVDASKLVARSDSFAVMVQGNAMGFQKTSLARTDGGFTYSNEVQIGPILRQSMQTAFSDRFVPQSVKGSGKVQGMDLAVDLAYAGGRVKGSSTTPGPQGMKTTTVDTTVAANVIDDNMVGALVPGLRWAPGAKFTFPAFDASTGATRQLTLAVMGTESVTVPAGTFETFRVEMSGQQQPMTMFVTTAAPHRVVKLSPAGAPIEFVLVK